MDITIGATTTLKEPFNEDHGFTRVIEAIPFIGLGALIQTTTILTNTDGSKSISTSSDFIASEITKKK